MSLAGNTAANSKAGRKGALQPEILVKKSVGTTEL